MANSVMTASGAEELYLDLLKKCLTRYVFGETALPYAGPPLNSPKRLLFEPVQRLLALRKFGLVRHVEFDPRMRADGRDWPGQAETMVGLKALDNIQECVTDVLRRSIRGDLIETGVWRGGASIFMRGILKAYGDSERRVWVADSFAGLPKPDAARYPDDTNDTHWTLAELAVPLDAVKANFERYDLLDDQVRFLVGWFRDTLPNAPIDQLAVARLDGDMYESTMDALTSLYPKLSLGGYLIVDDYAAVPGCRAAVDDYRAEHGITETMQQINWAAMYWQRLR